MNKIGGDAFVARKPIEYHEKSHQSHAGSYREVIFGLLQRWEIAKTVEEGASLLIQALRGEFPSGSFIGAMSGTGGQIGDQTMLEGGRMLRDEKLQDMAYDTIRSYL